MGRASENARRSETIAAILAEGCFFLLLSPRPAAVNGICNITRDGGHGRMNGPCFLDHILTRICHWNPSVTSAGSAPIAGPRGRRTFI